VKARGSNSAFWADLGQSVPPLLLGYPVYFSSAMDSVISSGSDDNVALLGDFRQAYRIVDRLGLSVIYQLLVIGGNRRPTGEAGWYAWWRVAGDVTDQTSATGLKLLHK
jgi:HK97 family phage major capsid protein